MNEQSGSRGEANFVWKCKNCKVGLESSEIYDGFVSTDRRLSRGLAGVQCHYQSRTSVLRTECSCEAEKRHSD